MPAPAWVFFRTDSKPLQGSCVAAFQLSLIHIFAGTGQTTILGIQVVDTGVASGIVLGFAAAWLFNRTCEKQFYGMITQLYSGLRWSFLWLSALAVALGLGFCFVCPPLQRAVSALTGWIAASGNAGVFLYGFLERLLIPTGLHHLIYMPFQFSSLGGSLTVGSVTYTGAYAVCMTEYTTVSYTHLLCRFAGRRTHVS